MSHSDFWLICTYQNYMAHEGWAKFVNFAMMLVSRQLSLLAFSHCGQHCKSLSLTGLCQNWIFVLVSRSTLIFQVFSGAHNISLSIYFYSNCPVLLPMNSSIGSSLSFEAPWLLTEGETLLIHFHSFPSLRRPPAVGGMGKERGFMRRSGVSWRDLAHWDEIGRGVWHENKPIYMNAGDRCLAAVKPPVKPNYLWWCSPAKKALVWRPRLPELCESSVNFHRSLFCCFFVYVQPPLALWPCQLFTTDRKKNLFHVCGKAEIGWDQALLEIWEADIQSTLGVFFLFFSCSGSSWDPWTSAVGF